MEDQTTPAIELRELMRPAGLTFKMLGDQVGVNPAQVFRALSGEIKLRPEVMDAIESAIVDAARDRAARLASVLGVITPPSQINQLKPNERKNSNDSISEKAQITRTRAEQRRTVNHQTGELAGKRKEDSAIGSESCGVATPESRA